MTVTVGSIGKASTIIVYRDKPTPGVFMVRRSPRATFMPNVLVFPGGRVEPSDHGPQWDRFTDLTEAEANAQMCLPPNEKARSLMIAAVRETFEEAGILLATSRNGDGLDNDQLCEFRERLNNQDQSFLSIVKILDCVLSLQNLSFISRWVTPEVERKRFDTCFFLAKVDGSQVRARADGKETHQGRWALPKAILEAHAQKELQLAPPTLRTLKTLSTLEPSAWHTLSRSDSNPICPQFVQHESKATLVMPGDPLHNPPGDILNRFVRIDSYWHSYGSGF